MADRDVRRRLAAILAADVVGYSRMMAADEAGTRADFNAHLNDLIGPALADRHGRIVKTTGDGLLAEFGSIVDAVTCAVAIQRGMAARTAGLDETRRMEFRIGVNLGEVIVEGDDVHGDGVNIAARLEGLADPGGVCVSAKVFEEVGNKLDVAFVDLGEREVKNIAAPVRVYRIDLGVEASEASHRQPRTSEAILSRPAVAVLPFVNMSGDPDQEFFADGLTEDLITALSYSRSFPVIARNSTFTYKGQPVKVQQVAADLGARYVIEGSVRKGGERVRITVQVIDAATGHHVWAERYDRELEDFFDLQEEIANRVAATVEPELARAEQRRSVGKATDNLDAWECYHRGLDRLERMTKEANAEARALFQRAIELDSGFGQAHAGLALSHHRDIYLDFAEDPAAAAAAVLEAAEKAVSLDDGDAFAHSMLGFAYIWTRRPRLAIAQCRKAIEVNPSSSWGYGVLAFATLCSGGLHEESIAAYEKALELSPKDPWNYIRTTFLAEALMYAGRYDEAVDWAQRSIGRASHHLHAHLVLAASLGYLDRRAEARTALDECERLQPDFAGSWTKFWSYRTEDDVACMRQGLVRAGLQE